MVCCCPSKVDLIQYRFTYDIDIVDRTVIPHSPELLLYTGSSLDIHIVDDLFLFCVNEVNSILQNYKGSISGSSSLYFFSFAFSKQSNGFVSYSKLNPFHGSNIESCSPFSSALLDYINSITNNNFKLIQGS